MKKAVKILIGATVVGVIGGIVIYKLFENSDLFEEDEYEDEEYEDELIDEEVEKDFDAKYTNKDAENDETKQLCQEHLSVETEDVKEETEV